MKDLIRLVYQIGYSDGLDGDYQGPPLDIAKPETIPDGYHTFEELYHHRCILFAALVNMMPQIAWKSKLHYDGTMYDDYFIVGLSTPEGDFSYHYHLDNWDLFDCEELERAPKWDGHTSEEVTRLLSLGVL